MSPTASVEKFPGWETLSHGDRAAIIDVVKKGAASKRKHGDHSFLFLFFNIT